MNALSPIPTQAPAIRAMVPQTMPEVFSLAEAVHKSGLAPAGLNNTQAVAIAILHGLELGVPPMTALQKIAVINGRPTIWGDLAMALVRSSGAAESIREEIVGEGDARAAVCTVKRKGEPEPIIGRFSVADAKRAGLWDDRLKVRRRNRTTGETYEAPNDAPWHRFPDRMMKMRARAFALRDGFADVLGGLYLREEIEEDQPVEVEPARPMPKPPVPPKVASTPALPAPQEAAMDKLSNSEVRETAMASPSAPAPAAKVPPKPPAPPAPRAAPRPPAPAGTDLFASGRSEDSGELAPPLLVDIEARFAMASSEPVLERMWAFVEAEVNDLPQSARLKAEGLYEAALARIQRGGK